MKSTWNRLASVTLTVFTTFTLHASSYYLQSMGGADGPPYPFDPTDGSAPISEIGPDRYYVADGSPELRSAGTTMTALSLDPGDPNNSGGGGGGSGGGATFALTVFTNAPEELLFDTSLSSSNNLLPSWRDTRANPVPDGMALGILIQTNCPFELTRIEAEVTFANPGSISDTEFEVGFFRSTNEFQNAMFVDPEYTASDVEGTLTKTLTDLGNGTWLLSIDLPTYAWGTNRIVTIRTVPNSDGAMAQVRFIACSTTVPGITAFASDNTTTNMIQVSLPKIKVWRRALSAFRSPSFEALNTELDLTMLPGYQLGSSTNLSSVWSWDTDELHTWNATIDTRDGNGFFIMRPDPTQ